MRPEAKCKRCGEEKAFRPHFYKKRAEVRVGVIRARDGDDCHICALPIRFDLPWDHQAAVSIDHIVPKARSSGAGGCDCPGNLRLAHRWCNMKRADNPPGTKLRLRGCAGHMAKVLAREASAAPIRLAEPPINSPATSGTNDVRASV